MYIKKKINDIFSDINTYTKIHKNPINKITNKLKNLLTKWKKSDFISNSTYKNIYCSNGVSPRAYGLPKIHKPNCPFRIIVSSIDSPLYALFYTNWFLKVYQWHQVTLITVLNLFKNSIIYTLITGSVLFLSTLYLFLRTSQWTWWKSYKMMEFDLKKLRYS